MDVWIKEMEYIFDADDVPKDRLMAAYRRVCEIAMMSQLNTMIYEDFILDELGEEEGNKFIRKFVSKSYLRNIDRQLEHCDNIMDRLDILLKYTKDYFGEE